MTPISMLPTYHCPECDEEFKGTPDKAKESFRCSCCASLLLLSPDGDYRDGYWHDETSVSVLEKGNKHETEAT